MKKFLLLNVTMLTVSYFPLFAASTISASHEDSTTISSADTQFFTAKQIVTEAYASSDYTMLLALVYAGIPSVANVNDFGGDFLQFGSGYESFRRLLSNVRGKVIDFTEPTLEEITLASTAIRERIFTTPVDAHTEYERAKAIATEAKEANNYTLAFALHLFYPGANVDDFGEGFFHYGACDESWQRFLADLKSRQADFKEPTFEEVASASQKVRSIILDTPSE